MGIKIRMKYIDFWVHIHVFAEVATNFELFGQFILSGNATATATGDELAK